MLIGVGSRRAVRKIIEKIEKAILEKYAEIKRQGSILTGIEDL